jgi:putative aldouronate transport system permease protein
MSDLPLNTGIRKEKTPFRRKFERQKYIFFIIIPGLLWYMLFKYYPLWFISKAFTNFGTVAKPSFIGMGNFVRLFAAPNFRRAFFNTLILAGYQLLFYFPIPILLALAMNELRSAKFKRAIQFTVYIPHFFSWVVVGGLFTLMLSPRNGIVNKVIEMMGHESIYFMASVKYFRSVIISSQIWKNAGYGTVVYVAAMSTINPELYDAAEVDGAGHLARTWHITLACIRNTIATVLLLNLSGLIRMFEQIFIMYNPAVMDVADVLGTFSYREAFQRGNVGYGTAIGLFTSAVSLILVLGTKYFCKRFLDEDII